jgi:hypothetical protein
MGYIDALKQKGSSEITVAVPRGDVLKKEQDDKCAKCKKDLKRGYFKFVKNPETKKDEIICSDCLVNLAKSF